MSSIARPVLLRVNNATKQGREGAQMNDSKQSTAIAGLLNYADASHLLNVKTGTLYSWVSRRVIPFVRLSPRVVRFKREEIEAWMGARSVEPAARDTKSNN